MPSSSYYQSLINQISKRSVESTVSMLGITDKKLRKHLSERFSDKLNSTSFLADPVFECMFPWERHSKRMEDLSGDLLIPSLVQSMDEAGDHRFGKDWFPFKHQVRAWKELLGQEDRKSAVVTSGTGSGKTECFMVPILNDLAKEFEQVVDPLVGVRALFVYPLNALINSQRERLRAWTAAYDDGVRFCLYNGNTEEYKHKEQGKNPNEILTRKGIRSTPPPIMVTNATMLEYMLVRQIDSPIIEQSQGKLRWIVLDEAHTYIGSQAAELSLLLRRVLHAFGVKARDVRFVATSATIGDQDSDRKLTEYLANLAGVSQKQIVIIGGKREVPELPSADEGKANLRELLKTDEGASYSTERYIQLASNERAVKLRQTIATSPVPTTLSQLAKSIFNDSSEESMQRVLELLDVSSYTQNPGPNPKKPGVDSQAFLPVRAHLFHQVINGLWCCIDKSCAHKKESRLNEEWPFGYVYTQRRNQCECGSPIYELVFCTDCNEPHLLAVLTSDGRLIQHDRASLDEFSLDIETSEEEQEEEDSFSLNKVYLSPRPNDECTYPVCVNPEDLSLQGMSAETIEVNLINSEDADSVCCACCGFERKPSPFRQSLLGTPFYISNTVPTLLEACQESENANECPARGRRLITFTDSRQGTARISTKIQQDSERDSIRGQVYKASINNKPNDVLTDVEKGKIDQLESMIEKFKGRDELVSEFISLRDEILEKCTDNDKAKPISWNDLVTKLQSGPDISTWMYDYYSDISPKVFNEAVGARTLAEMVLLREFARRPKRQNSLETLGLVAVTYPALRGVTRVPPEWEKLYFTLDDWRDFLKVTLDFYVRENTIFDIPPEWTNWMGAKIYAKTVMNPESEENTGRRIRKWPQAIGARSSRLVRMIATAAKMDLSNKYNIDLINSIMRSAWHVLTSETKILKPQSGTLHYNLSRQELAFLSIKKAWVCPVTHRLLDTVFKGLTPYLPFNSDTSTILCKEVNIPVCDIDTSRFVSEKQRIAAVRDWVSNSSGVAALREENLWTDISDRVVEGGAFFRAAEHSAQQPASRLQKYESLFKKGKLNVLSCSTTMEMGVDIGGISVVAMNNVPPHPSNYLQRAGRAGRRGETQAAAFTICKDNPHERAVFANPRWPFVTSIPAPYIVLNSAQIVQRHINSLLLSHFLKHELSVSSDKPVLSLNCEWFFVDGDIEESPYKKMCRWLEVLSSAGFPKDLEQGVNSIVKTSVISSKSSTSLSESAKEALQNVAGKWLPKYEQLKRQIEELEKVSNRDPFKKKMEYDLKRFSMDYLLSELASNAFLPGYGFPTGVATFDNYSAYDFTKNIHLRGQDKGRIDNLTRMRERPGRDISVAIREYAPGADVVIDGLVYKSAGILLNPFAPDEDFGKPVKVSSEWRCHQCGCIGQSTSSIFDHRCAECGEELKRANIREFIEPLGFAVDFYSTPSTDISTQHYIPVEEPWITAKSALRALYNPLLGSYRSSSEGHIFHHSSGDRGSGYAICLKCGRAESMPAENEYPSNLQPGKPHRKLQGKAGTEGEANCPGGESQHAIAANVYLGASDQTDVFELYLKDPGTKEYLLHKPNDSVLWTIAVAMRQALADIHGITSDEIGYTVKPTSLPGCASASGIALYDRCGGGAGFSSSAPYHIKEMLLIARKYLECPEECGSACQSCLLGYDTRFHVSVLDRFKAIEFFEPLLKLVEIPKEQRIFGDSTRFCLSTLDAEILRRADQGYETISLFLQGEANTWDLVSSGVKGRISNWIKRFSEVNVVLALNSGAVVTGKLSEDLANLKAIGASLKQASPTDLPLVLLRKNDESVAFDITGDGVISVPNEGFWNQDNLTLVFGDLTAEPETSEFTLESVTSGHLVQGDVEVEITTECDANVSRFGSRLWGVLCKHNDKLSELIGFGTKIQSISYSDAYICSPWSFILFAAMVDGLKQKTKESWSNPYILLNTGEKDANPRAKGIYAEWRNTRLKEQVFSAYFEKMGERLTVNFAAIRDMAHSRSLVVEWASGDTTTVRFDHGMGYWSISNRGRIWFDVEADPDKQVKDLIQAMKVASTKQGREFPTQVFIKNR